MTHFLLCLAFGIGSSLASSSAWADSLPGAEPLDPLALDPLASAQHYARTQRPWSAGIDFLRAGFGGLSYEPRLERTWTYADLVLARRELLHPVGRFWAFEGSDTAALVLRLQRWQRRLAVRVGASDHDEGGQENFEGLGELEESADYGRTFAAANGTLRGDLTLVFGKVGNAATVQDVQEGRASFLDLNPFREVGAQFDFAIFEDAERENGGIMIFRIRAAYLGLFDEVQGGDSAGVAGESQAGCGVGIKW